jgi:hypothetical protein
LICRQTQDFCQVMETEGAEDWSVLNQPLRELALA